jgi:dihydroorotate dehydrogenase
MKHLEKTAHTVPLGINITKTPDPSIMGEAGVRDFCESFKAVLPLADYITLNISCPNTAEGKTFEEPQTLRALLQELQKLKDETPVLIKISSDVDEQGLDSILEISESFGMAGYVLGNTSLSRDQLKTSPTRLAQIGRGGLSGKPLAQRSLAQIRYVRKKLPGTVLIGCGGIFTAADAQERLQAGANLLQIYTGLIYEGPSLCKNILRGLNF